MLYTIRFQYCRMVSAGSSREAYAKACKAIREDPGSIVSRVEAGSSPRKKPGVLRRMIFGD
jgi:hypothetical protein